VVGWEEEGSEAAGVGWRRVSAPAVWTSGTLSGRTCCAVEGLAGSALMGFILLQRKRSCHCGRCMILGYAMMQTSPLSRIAFVLPPIRPKYNHIPTDSSPNLKTMVLTKRIVVLLPVSECPKSHVPRKKDHNSPNHGCPPGSRQQSPSANTMITTTAIQCLIWRWLAFHSCLRSSQDQQQPLPSSESVELGAGCGWFASRSSERGARVIAEEA